MWTLILTFITGPIVASRLDPIPCVGMMVAGQATMVTGSTKEKFFKSRLVESYEEILVIACEEASKWSTSNLGLDVHLTYSQPSEEVLQKQGMPFHVWIFALLH